ncbi:MAG: chorismate-binding protein, partial [Melioribacteraceae bacterium]|nr:chorismate-binding protein [Melioribacteraceae bacterium]
MNFEEFIELSKTYNVIPVYERITGDLLTPVLAFLKIREKNKYCFLLESVEGIGRLARYSFIGKDPVKIISNKGNLLKIIKNGDVETKQRNIFEFLKEEIKSYKFPNIDDLPDFTGGIVGYLGYENISLIENVIEFNHTENSTNPDSIFGFFNTLIAFDHFKHQLLLITNVHINGNSDIEFEYNNAKNILADLKREISTPLKYKSDFIAEEKEYFNVDEKEFFEIVEKTKNHIYEGDVFQMVISKKFETTYSGDLLNVYRALRIINPSPYMYFMEFG